jgi:uncharacterized protein YjlB
MTPKLNLQPLSSLRVSRHQIPAHGLLPNTSVSNHPLLIYHSVFPAPVSPSLVESHLDSLGVVSPQWRYTMYRTTHYHSLTHEVLCVTRGRARLCFGGERNDGRVEVTVAAGDAIVVPAGVAHCLLQDLDDGEEEEGRGESFEMVGSYPGGRQWDMCYGKAGEEDKVDHIRGLEWFTKDPIYGDKGPAIAAE